MDDRPSFEEGLLDMVEEGLISSESAAEQIEIMGEAEKTSSELPYGEEPWRKESGSMAYSLVEDILGNKTLVRGATPLGSKVLIRGNNKAEVMESIEFAFPDEVYQDKSDQPIKDEAMRIRADDFTAMGEVTVKRLSKVGIELVSDLLELGVDGIAALDVRGSKTNAEQWYQEAVELWKNA